MESLRFGFNENVLLVKGAKRGAIYDLNNGEVYSIDESFIKVADMLNAEYTIREVSRAFPELSFSALMNRFKKLQALGIGKLSQDRIKSTKSITEKPEFKLNFMWLEITRSCNLKCLHCYAKSNNSRPNWKRLKIREWQKIVRDGFSLGCRKMQIIGGEPLLFPKTMISIIELAKLLGYEVIEVFTNATLLTDQLINFLARNNIQVAVSVYSKKPEIHDNITQVSGSFEQTITNINKLRNGNVKVRLSTIVLQQNECYLEETLSFFTEMGEQQTARCFDIVRPVGRGNNNCLLPRKMNSWRYRKGPVFPKITKSTFIRRKYGHSCWTGSIAITYKGDVIPCIMARRMVCGNITQQSLKEITKGKKLLKLWGLSKDKIKRCQDCEYRYLCVDCRPLIKGRINDPDQFCTYDPYSGQWGH